MPTALRRLAIIVAALALLGLPGAPAHARSDIGVVVLHGKQGTGGDRTTAPFLRALTNAGYAVQAPTMCWSGSRIYDMAFPDCLREIDTAVAALRAAGARRIVVAGQSLGGLAALVYGAQHPELAGVVGLAPAGQPAALVRNRQVAQSLAQARQMLAAGQGAQRSSLTDANNGATFTVFTTPAIFVSFLDPDGPANLGGVLSQVRVPVIWVAGSLDRTQDQAQALFARIPANPLNRFVSVTSTHLGTPAAGADAVLEWLKTLPAQ